MINIKLLSKFKVFLLLFLLQNTVFAVEDKIGGGHPNTNISIKRYGRVAPQISDEVIFREDIAYQDFVSRAEVVESNVRSVFTDGRRKVVINGYSVHKIPSKYDGDCGIDDLFLVKKNGEKTGNLVAVESKYLSAQSPKFSFGPGIRHEDGVVPQMSTAWIRIVAHTLYERALENDRYRGLYDLIKKDPCQVIRAIATGDKDGHFKISLLEGYPYAARDAELLRAIFQ